MKPAILRMLNYTIAGGVCFVIACGALAIGFRVADDIYPAWGMCSASK